jgi:hypothetical protein
LEELTSIVNTNLLGKKRIFEEYNNKANEEMEELKAYYNP